MKTPIQKLAKKVEQESDSFAEGDVIRWVAQPELSRAYTYVAVKAGGRWWISGTSAWYVHSGVDYQQLTDYLTRAEVHSIQAVTEWSDKVKEEAPQLRLARATAEAAPTCGGCGLTSPCFC